MKNKKKLLLSALLSVSVMVPAFSEVLSDEELEEVSAQGLQVVNDEHVGDLSNQDNNLDSVYLDGNTMSNSTLFEAVNSASSAGNVQENMLEIDGGFDYEITQGNYQNWEDFTDPDTNYSAMNHSNVSMADDLAIAGNINKQSQSIDIGLDIDPNKDGVPDNAGVVSRITGRFDNNNNSVQMRDDALRYSENTILVNSAMSAFNTGMNDLYVDGGFGSSLTQENLQDSANFSNYASGTAAIGINAELNTDIDLGSLTGNPDQDLVAYSKPTQRVANHFNRRDGLNGLASDPHDPDSPNNPANVNYIRDNSNNNNSVQTKDNTEEQATTGYLSNIAQSGANFGFNIASMGNVDSNTDITQSNIQRTANHGNYVEGGFYALAGNFNKETQNIDNMDVEDPITLYNATGIIKEQDNNNNSVQKKNNSEASATVIVGVNAAMSGINTGLNVLDAGKINSGSYINQSNEQKAYNFDNYASGGVSFAENAELTPYKDNDGNVIPYPIETGKPVSGPGQMVHNVHVTVLEQNNNNNSVQLANDAQGNGYSFFESVNAANSAMNTGMNVLGAGTTDILNNLFGTVGTKNIVDSTVEQYNDQLASNHNNIAEGFELALAGNKNKQIQWIDNCSCTDIASVRNITDTDPLWEWLGTPEGPQQNNNMNSVQIRDRAQQDTAGVFMGNAANSAVNASMNYLTANSLNQATIVQNNTAVSNNWTNNATAVDTAIAGNFENITW